MNAVVESIMGATRVVPLIEAVELNPRPDRAALPDDLEVSFVPMAAVEAGSGRMDGTAIRRFGEVKKGYTAFLEGDVLFAKITPCMENGKMAVASGLRNGVGCGSTEFHVLRPRQGVDPHYVYYFVSSAHFRAKASHHMTGAVGQKRVPAAFLERCEIPLPDLANQRRIVAELEKQFSRLDEAVANLKRVTSNLKRYRAATLAEAFDMKPTWAVSSYGEVGVVTTGYTPPTTDEANFGGAIPFVKPTDLDAGDNIFSAREYLSELGLSKGRLLPPNSVLVTCIGATIGKTSLARVACATNQQINAVTPDPRKVDARFLYWWTASPRGQEQIISNASATTLPILNKSKFAALTVPLPPVAEQQQIVAEIEGRLAIVRAVEDNVKAGIKRTLNLRSSCLSASFQSTGIVAKINRRIVESED